MVVVREPNSENCLDLTFAAPPFEKVIIVPDTSYITSAIRKFTLDMSGPCGLQNISLFIWTQWGSEHVKPCGSNWVRIKELLECKALMTSFTSTKGVKSFNIRILKSAKDFLALRGLSVVK